MFALIADEVLHIRVNNKTRQAFADAGGELFTYEKGGKPVELSYLTVPDDAAKHVDEMRPWTDMAIVIANRTQTRKKPRKS
ncbi:MAG: hypothetical protein CMM26_05225 [Rhodospirillaceae bacterium]|nr:hypothetical protein [Rhodospirillaceae bacterium]|tara:strand:- start:456 stop:698 length:243 start_codon:yes stop_codon:yes gene_type:complete